MLSIGRRFQRSHTCLHFILRSAHAGSPSPQQRRRSKFSPSAMLKKVDDTSEWWVVDGEMHEIGENIPPRERFVIPRENIPNKRRKQLRDQFMRRTRLVLKESEHEPWGKRYIELYNEMRENWERLYWDEGYSKKLALDHANYDSAEDDDQDFSPYLRRSNPNADQMQERGGMGRNRQGDNWEKVSLIRDKFEYDRESRMREKVDFGSLGGEIPFGYITSEICMHNKGLNLQTTAAWTIPLPSTRPSTLEDTSLTVTVLTDWKACYIPM